MLANNKVTRDALIPKLAEILRRLHPMTAGHTFTTSAMQLAPFGAFNVESLSPDCFCVNRMQTQALQALASLSQAGPCPSRHVNKRHDFDFGLLPYGSGPDGLCIQRYTLRWLSHGQPCPSRHVNKRNIINVEARYDHNIINVEAR